MATVLAAMPEETWFIGSRRRYPTTSPPREAAPGVDRLDPADFLRKGATPADEARLREFELEVLERVTLPRDRY